MEQITADQMTINRDFSPPGYYKYMEMHREIIKDDVKLMKLDIMPGLRVAWYYTGIDVKPEFSFIDKNNILSVSFLRYCFQYTLHTAEKK